MGRKRKVKPIENCYFKGTKCKEPVMDYRTFFKEHPFEQITENSKNIEFTDEEVKVYMDWLAGKMRPESVLTERMDAQLVLESFKYFCESRKLDDSVPHADKVKQWENTIRQNLIDDLAETWAWGEDEEKISHYKFYVEHFGDFPPPVSIPSWMFAANTFAETNFHLDNFEMVALAHAIYFTKHNSPTGYMECSGHVERWCRCSVDIVHHAFMTLYEKGLVDYRLLPPLCVHGLTRNIAWKADIPYIESVLSNYGRRINI